MEDQVGNHSEGSVILWQSGSLSLFWVVVLGNMHIFFAVSVLRIKWRQFFGLGRTKYGGLRNVWTPIIDPHSAQFDCPKLWNLDCAGQPDNLVSCKSSFNLFKKLLWFLCFRVSGCSGCRDISIKKLVSKCPALFTITKLMGCSLTDQPWRWFLMRVNYNGIQ